MLSENEVCGLFFFSPRPLSCLHWWIDAPWVTGAMWPGEGARPLLSAAYTIASQLRLQPPPPIYCSPPSPLLPPPPPEPPSSLTSGKPFYLLKVGEVEGQPRLFDSKQLYHAYVCTRRRPGADTFQLVFLQFKDKPKKSRRIKSHAQERGKKHLACYITSIQLIWGCVLSRAASVCGMYFNCKKKTAYIWERIWLRSTVGPYLTELFVVFCNIKCMLSWRWARPRWQTPPKHHSAASDDDKHHCLMAWQSQNNLFKCAHALNIPWIY